MHLFKNLGQGLDQMCGDRTLPWYLFGGSLGISSTLLLNIPHLAQLF